MPKARVCSKALHTMGSLMSWGIELQGNAQQSEEGWPDHAGNVSKKIMVQHEDNNFSNKRRML